MSGGGSLPRYGEQRVSTAPLPTIRVPTTVPEKAVPHLDLGGVERAAQSLYDRAIDHADQVSLTQFNANLAASETKILYDPQSGIMNMRGENALKARDVFNEQWKKAVDDASKGLHNQRQRDAGMRAVADRYATLDRAVSQHIYQQSEEHDNKQTQALVDNESTAMAAAMTKGITLKAAGERATDGVRRIQATLYDWGMRKGLSDAEVNQMVEQATSHAHALAIEQMIANSDDITAQRYYNTFHDELRGEESLSVQKAVEVSSRIGESQRTSLALYSKYSDSPEKAIAEAQKISDPQTQDQVVTRLEHMYDREKSLARDRQDVTFNRVKNQIEPLVRSGVPFVLSDHVSRADLANLSPQQEEWLERRALHADGDYPNNVQKWHQFLNMSDEQLGNLNQSEFETQFYQYFDRETRARAEIRWAGAAEKLRTGKVTTKHASDALFRGRMMTALGDIDPKFTESKAKLNDRQRQFLSRFASEAERRKEYQEMVSGKPLTADEMDKVLDGVRKDVVFQKGGFFGLGKEQPSTVKHPTLITPYNRIPQDRRNDIEQTLKQAKKIVSPDKVSRLYAAWLAGNQDLVKQIMQEP